MLKRVISCALKTIIANLLSTICEIYTVINLKTEVN